MSTRTFFDQIILNISSFPAESLDDIISYIVCLGVFQLVALTHKAASEVLIQKIKKVLKLSVLSTTMNQPTEIGALPPEMLVQVLNHLNLADLVKLKSVCKLWNELITANVKVSELIVDAIADTRRSWFSSVNKPFDKRNMEVCHANLFFTNLEKPILSQLKFLRLNPGMGPHVLKPINSFKELLRLDINYQLCGYLEVNLPKLEILKIWNNLSGLVRLDCPKLKKLLYEESGAGNLWIIYPETVLELSTAMYGEMKLSGFKNLKILKCNNEPNALNEQTLTMMPRLKRLQYDGSLCLLSDWYNGFAEVRLILERFIANKNALKRTDLQFYLGGVQLTDNLDEIDFGVRQKDGTIEIVSDERFYIRNYDRLQEGPLEFVNEANYTSLMSATDQIPADYFDRFVNVESVTADGRVGNQEHFLWYLKNQRSKLCQLKLENTGLEQNFYDSLPTFCSPYEIQINENQELNYDFLREFKHLKRTWILQELSLRSAKSLLESHANLRQFEELEFRFKNQILHVHCNIHGLTRMGFVWYIDRKIAHEAEHLEEIIEWVRSNVF